MDLNYSFDKFFFVEGGEKGWVGGVTCNLWRRFRLTYSQTSFISDIINQ